MKGTTSILLFFAVCALIGCESSMETEVTRLVEAKALWESTLLRSNYSFEFSIDCLNKNAEKINVNRAESFIVEDFGDVRQIDSDELTVEYLFTFTLGLIKEREKTGRNFKVEYDKNYGHPTYIKTWPSRDIIDSGGEMCISNMIPNDV